MDVKKSKKSQDSQDSESKEKIETYLWGLGEKLKTNDDKTEYRLKHKICEVDEKNYLKLEGLDLKICQRAVFGHPNKKGAIKYTEKIKEQLGSITFSI